MFKQHTWCLTIWMENVNDFSPFPFSIPKLTNENSNRFEREGIWQQHIRQEDRRYTKKDWRTFQPNLSSKGIIFICGGIEVTQRNQRAHLQTVVVYEKAKSFQQVKKQFPTAHIEYAKGTLQENIKYCIKDGAYHIYTLDKKKATELTLRDNSEMSAAKVLNENVDWKKAGELESYAKRILVLEEKLDQMAKAFLEVSGDDSKN